MAEHTEILVVEDNQADLKLTTRAIRACNVQWRITVVRDGEQALEFLFARGEYAGRSPELLPKVVLLDLKLPKVTGLQVLEQVKNDSLTRMIPVVVLTSSNQHEDVLAAYKRGANSYVQKPVDADNFEKVIRSTVDYWLSVNLPPPGEVTL
jgi:CheY-like chemotaxis protein